MQHFPVGGQAAPIRHLERQRAWSVPISPAVTVVNDPPYRCLYVHGVFHSRFHLARPEDERYALVMLVEAGHITQRRLAEAYGLDADTINNWVRRYRQFGAAGLLRVNPAKLESRPEPAKAVTPAPPAPEQLRLGLGQPVAAADAPAPATHDLPEQPTCPTTGTAADGEPAAVDVLAVGESRYTRYAGALLALPFLQAALAPALQYVADRQAQFHGFGRLWRIQDLLVGLVLFFFAGVPNLEQTKALHRREFGVLLARRRSPSCRTLRRNLPWLTVGNLPRELRRLIASQLLALGWVEPGQWQLDGHFVPYHGQGKLPKGYWPQRREGHRGHHQHWVCDRRGRPLFVLHHQGFAAFVHVIPDLVREVMALQAERYPGELLLLVFDRGGYSAELFAELDRLAVVFVTWKKHARPLPEAAFAGAATLTLGEGKAARTFQYVPTHVQVRHYHDNVYALVLREPETGRQMTLISNADRMAPGRYTPADLAEALLRRWALENYLKVVKERYGLDQILGHELVEPGDEDWPVPNPQYVRLKRRLAAVQALLQEARRDEEGLRTRFEGLKRKPSWPRFLKRKRNRKILERRQAFEAEHARVAGELAQTPAQLPYRQLHPENVQGLRLDRADVVTTLRAVAFHVRAQLSDRVAACFADARERGKFLDALIHSGGTYRRLPEVDLVTLRAPDTPVYRRAAEVLLQGLNELKPVAPDGSARTVRFELEKS